MLNAPSSPSRVLMLLGMLVTLVVTQGCAARRVVRGADYGVVAIPADSNSWPMRYRDKAHELMNEHFPEGYEIDHEEEVVVGQQVHTHTDGTGATIFRSGPIELTSGTAESTTTTTDNTEWRIYYRRKQF